MEGGWGIRSRLLLTYMGAIAISKAKPGTCGRGRKDVGRRLEAVQDKVGRKLLGASRTVAGEAAHGKLGCRKL